MEPESDPELMLRSLMSEAGSSHRQSQVRTGLVAVDVEDEVTMLLTEELDEVDIYGSEEDGDRDEEEADDDIKDFVAGKITFKELARKMDAEDDMEPEAEDEPHDASQASDQDLAQPRRRSRRRGRRSKLDEMGASLLGNAELYFARGKCEDAIAMVLEVVKDHPLAHELYQTLADFYEQLGEDDKALQYYHIAAYLCPNDGDGWRTVAEKHVEQGDFKTAVSCYEKAIRLIAMGREHIDCRMERARILAEHLSECKKALTAYISILNLCQDQDGEFASNLAQRIAKLHFECGDNTAAIAVLESVFQKYESCIESENVNMYIELLIGEKAMAKALMAFSRYCGVQMQDSQSGNPVPGSAIDSLTEDEIALIAVQLQFPVPIDLLTKLIVCLISVRATHSVPTLQKRIEDSPVEQMGDLHLDVADAFVEANMHQDAEPFLVRLVESGSYGSQASVWLRHARCLRQLGHDDRSIDAYFRVVSLDPNHSDARLELSRLLLANDRSAEAVEVSSQVDSAIVNMDLLCVRCQLLFQEKRFSEFLPSALTLLQSDMIFLQHDREISCMITSTTHRTRLESLRDVHRELKISPPNVRQKFTGREPVSDEFLSVFSKVCHIIAHMDKDYPKLIRMAMSGYTSRLLTQHESSLDFIALMALYFSHDVKFSYLQFKAIIGRDPKNNQVWNVFCPIVSRIYQDLRHNRFCLRLFIKHPDLLPLAYFNGHNALMSGSYKHALAEYVNIHRQRPDDPFPIFCICNALVHLASQKFMSSKNSIVVQLCSFLAMYISLRGECQESFFNAGRMFHQIGLLQNAVHFYQRALHCPVAVPITGQEKSIFDLSSEIAYNLATVYKSSGSVSLSLFYLRKYCVV